MFRQLCGDSTLKDVVIAMNTWSEVSKGDHVLSLRMNFRI
jgi:hypothetical protein